jgi:multidrug efflux pump subunit AcrA (membrane-fusion protein)
MTGFKTYRVAIAIGAVLVVLAVVFHTRLIDWFTGARSGGPFSPSATATAGDWTLGAALEPDPPQQKGNRMRVEIRDAAGEPVAGAAVSITWDMPAMGSMPEMKGSFDAKPAGAGLYQGSFDLPMAGSWTMIVAAKAGARSATARFTLTVGAKGLTVSGADAGADEQAGVVRVDPARQKAIGIRTETVVAAPLALEIRAVGKLTYDETRLSDVVLKVSGYVSNLRVTAMGQSVKKGDTLFLLYSPELFAAQQDYLLARSSRDALGGAGRGDDLVRAAETKLSLLGLVPSQIEAIAKTGKPIEKLAFTAPASGSVIEKNVVEGASIKAGDRVLRLAALDKVWVEADVFEADLARIAKDQPATIALSYIADRTFEGKVTFVYPYLDPSARTGRVRIELPNAGLELKPDMYANVTFHVALGNRLQIPTSAIMFTGPRRVVIVDLGGGRLAPREVKLGAQSGDRSEVMSGVTEGEAVVTAGNFLIAAESRIRSSGTFWKETP